MVGAALPLGAGAEWGAVGCWSQSASSCRCSLELLTDSCYLRHLSPGPQLLLHFFNLLSYLLGVVGRGCSQHWGGGGGGSPFPHPWEVIMSPSPFLGVRDGGPHPVPFCCPGSLQCAQPCWLCGAQRVPSPVAAGCRGSSRRQHPPFRDGVLGADVCCDLGEVLGHSAL